MFRFETDGRTSGADLPTRPVALVSARRDTVHFGTNRGELAADGRAGGEILPCWWQGESSRACSRQRHDYSDPEYGVQP